MAVHRQKLSHRSKCSLQVDLDVTFIFNISLTPHSSLLTKNTIQLHEKQKKRYEIINAFK
jgi:hypothetical protein